MLEQLSRIAAWFSQGVNCILLGGHHDQTVSARAYVNRRKPRWRHAYRVINAIFFWQADHYLESHAADRVFAREILGA